MPEKIIGILGGMGPEATIDLFTKIVKGTGAKKDQDHLRILIDNNPKIPDRTLAIQGKGPSPLSQMVRSAKALERAGADFMIIPCVTAHYYHRSLQQKIRIPILHLVEETASYIQAYLRGIRKIGLVATSGTIRTGLFQASLHRAGKELLIPPREVQEKSVMKAIYGKDGIKAIGPSEKSKRLVQKVCRLLIRQGAQAIIAGCTEIPLVLKQGDVPVPVIDPLSILAGAALKKARRKRG